VFQSPHGRLPGTFSGSWVISASTTRCWAVSDEAASRAAKFDYTAHGVPGRTARYCTYADHIRSTSALTRSAPIKMSFSSIPVSMPMCKYLNSFRDVTVRKLTRRGQSARVDMKQYGWSGASRRSRAMLAVEEEGTDLVPKSWQLCRKVQRVNRRCWPPRLLMIISKMAAWFSRTKRDFRLHPMAARTRLNESHDEQVFFVRG